MALDGRQEGYGRGSGSVISTGLDFSTFEPAAPPPGGPPASPANLDFSTFQPAPVQKPQAAPAPAAPTITSQAAQGQNEGWMPQRHQEELGNNPVFRLGDQPALTQPIAQPKTAPVVPAAPNPQEQAEQPPAPAVPARAAAAAQGVAQPPQLLRPQLWPRAQLKRAHISAPKLRSAPHRRR